MNSIKSAIRTDLFTAGLHYQKLDQLGDPFMWIGAFIDFTALAAQVNGADLGIETLCIILRMNKWHTSFWIATAINVSVTCWMPRAYPIAQPSAFWKLHRGGRYRSPICSGGATNSTARLSGARRSDH